MSARRRDRKEPAKRPGGDKFTRYANARLELGATIEGLKSELVFHGLDAAAADALIERLTAKRRDLRRERGRKNMLMGGLFVGAGASFAVVTRGATPDLAWAVIAFGAAQLVHGLVRFFRS